MNKITMTLNVDHLIKEALQNFDGASVCGWRDQLQWRPWGEPSGK